MGVLVIAGHPTMSLFTTDGIESSTPWRSGGTSSHRDVDNPRDVVDRASDRVYGRLRSLTDELIELFVE